MVALMLVVCVAHTLYIDTSISATNGLYTSYLLPTPLQHCTSSTVQLLAYIELADQTKKQQKKLCR